MILLIFTYEIFKVIIMNKYFTHSILHYLILTLLVFFRIGSSMAYSEAGDTTDVVHYEIHIENINTNTQEIQAYAELLLTPLYDNINKLHLQLMNLTVDSVTSEEIGIVSFQHTSPDLFINLQENIGLSDSVHLKIFYHGIPFHENWGGYHFAGDYSFNLGVGISYVPHNLGKSWFPCVDDFTDRATYDIYVTLGEGLTAVCGGTLEDKTDNGSNAYTYYWTLPQSIPTYLASVATGYYELTEWTYNGNSEDIPVQIYTKPSDTSNVSGTFANLNDITNVFENHFGDYPWDRIGYVGTAIGAMEHATNIAFPNSYINGTLSSETIMAHELSHMWFGDLVTCDKAEEMWLNEGWATFCGAFYKEFLYSEEDYYEEIWEYNADVLQFCHTPSGDGDYFPLNNIPQSHTYGVTAYDRGATVIQSLRSYLGDSLFFQGVKDYLTEYAFNHASSEDLRDALSNSTGVDMHGFFDNWVLNAGTPHYSIDSFTVSENGGLWEVHLYPRQKRKGPQYTGDANIIEIGYVNDAWQMIYDTLKFDGQSGHSVKTLDFKPLAVFTDPEGKTCDATTDATSVIHETGDYSFSNTFFTLKVNEIADSALIMLTHNWVAPDSLVEPINGLTLSDYRYWKIEGVFPEEYNATGIFLYSKGSYLDNNLIKSAEDSVIIMYRPDPSYNWQFIDFERIGSWVTGNLYVDNLQNGEYTLAAWDKQYVGKNETAVQTKAQLEAHPNPSNRVFTIQWNDDDAFLCEIYDNRGRLVDTISGLQNRNMLKWDAGYLGKGVYYIILFDKQHIVLGHQKLIYQ